MSIASVVTRGRGFGGIRKLVTHGLGVGEAPTPDDGIELLGGGYTFSHPYERLKESKRREEIDREIAAKERQLETERAALQKMRDEKRDNEILARQAERLDTALREEITLLLREKEALIRLIDDEEAILTLLLSMPFSS